MLDEINTIHLQISVAADSLPPADDRQVPVVVVEPPELSSTFGFSGNSGGGAVSIRACNVDLTLKKVQVRLPQPEPQPSRRSATLHYPVSYAYKQPLLYGQIHLLRLLCLR